MSLRRTESITWFVPLIMPVMGGRHGFLRMLFSEKALRDQEGLIGGYVDTLINKLRVAVRHGSSVVDIKVWMNLTTFDITGDLMLGESFDCF